MQNEKLIDDIINLPLKYYHVGNVSFYSLLESTGYFEFFDQISIDKIFDRLSMNPESGKQWLNWSENKRTSSGWYFTQDDNKKFIIGYYPEHVNYPVLEFSISEKLVQHL